MKRFIILLLIVCSLLCGCTRPAEYREPEQVIITSALGFDNVNGQLALCAETVKTGEKTGSYTPQIFTGMGDNVSLVLQSTSDSLGGELFLGHCTTVILGTTLTQAQIKDIFSFLQENSQISLAIKLVCANNAKEALSSKTFSSEAVGYDILKLLTTKSDTADNKNYACLYNIAGYKEGLNPCVTLPFFSITENEEEKYLYPDGAAIYFDDILVYRLSSKEETFFKLLSDNYSKGIIKIGTENIDVEKSRCKINTHFSDNTLKVDFHISITPKNGAERKDISSAIENECLSFLSNVQTQIREDIFYIAEKIKKHYPIIFEKIERHPLDAFLNAEISVHCKIKKGED